jgi:hypothetical protein
LHQVLAERHEPLTVRLSQGRRCIGVESIDLEFQIAAGACTTSPAEAWQAYLGRPRYDYLVRRDDVEPFRGVLADPVLEAAAARASLVGHIDDDIFARRMQ